MRCDQKQSFETKKIAKKVLDGIIFKRATQLIDDGKKTPLRVYKCECGKWHLTSITVARQKRIEYRKTDEYRIAKIAQQWIGKKGWENE